MYVVRAGVDLLMMDEAKVNERGRGLPEGEAKEKQRNKRLTMER